MVYLEFLVPIEREGDVELFKSVPGLQAEFSIEKTKGLNATELALTLLISIGSSATYDLLKASAVTLTARLRDYFSHRNASVVSLNGIQYRTDSQTDMDSLSDDVIDAVDNHHADTHKSS